MLKKGYKKTVAGYLPIEWQVKSVGEVIEFQGGAQPPKEYFVNEEKEGYIRLIQIRDYKTEEYKTYIPFEMARKFCNKEDIMIGRYGPPIFQILKGLEGAYNVALLKAIPNEEIVDREYVRYFLSTEKLFKLIDRLSQRTSGQTGVDMEALNNYIMPIPLLKEQQKISGILSTVDSQIDDTDKLIEKTKELKKGLMQRLLTKGIGHTEFKKTEIGEMPVEWEVKTIDKLSAFCSNGFVGTASPYYIECGTPYLMSNNVRENKIDESKLVMINDEFVNIYPRSKIFKGDMLTVQSGHIGTSCVVNEKFNNCNCHALIITRFIKGNINPNFCAYYLNSSIGKRRLTDIFVGTTIKHINVKDFVKFKIPVPSIDEQVKIADILSSVDTQIEEYENKKAKLKQLKKGLMQQLLTGKVRVEI